MPTPWAAAALPQLGWVEGEEGNLLLGDPILTSRPTREHMATLVFETFNVAGYYVSDQAVLSLYAIGKLNGTVVDVGAQTIGKPQARPKLAPSSPQAAALLASRTLSPPVLPAVALHYGALQLVLRHATPHCYVACLTAFQHHCM